MRKALLERARKQKAHTEHVPLSPALAGSIHTLSAPISSLQPTLAFGSTSLFALAPQAWETARKELLRYLSKINTSKPIAVASALPLPSSHLLQHDTAWAPQGSSVFVQLLFMAGTTVN